MVPVAAYLASSTVLSHVVHRIVSVSSSSSSVSPSTLTATVFSVSPGRKVSWPVIAL